MWMAVEGVARKREYAPRLIDPEFIAEPVET
jgi:hypothetical protein